MLIKIYNILNKKQKKSFFIQIILMLISMFFETIGIGILLPALSIMSNDKLIYSNPQIVFYLHKLNIYNTRELIIFIFCLILIINVIKMFFMTFVVYKQSVFVSELDSFVSEKLFSGYLNLSYNFHLQRNSAHLIRNVITLTAQYSTVIGAIISLFSEVFILFGIISFLLFIQPIGTALVLLFFGISMFIFHKISKKYIFSWGAKFYDNEGLRVLTIQQGFGAIKDLKILGRTTNFLSKFSTVNFNNAKITKSYKTLQAIPRLILEFLSIASIAALTLYLVHIGKSLSDILTIIGLFAAASIRIMPSINRIMTAIQTIKYGNSHIINLENEFNIIKLNHNTGIIKTQNIKVEKLNFNNSLELKNIHFKYEGSNNFVLKDINLKLNRGTSIGFIGTSGAGKSTIVNLIIGLLSPTSGQILVDEKDITLNLRSWQNQIGYVSQTIFLTDDSIRNNIALGLNEEEIDDTSIMNAIKYAQLEEFIDELPNGLNTIVGERGVRISGGQIQRIGIARALYHNPEVLIFDEATSALDNATETSFIKAIENLSKFKTIIIIAHRLSTIKNCDYIYKLENGIIISEGNVSQMI
jgi:ABC-type multidrug transport system fused ATPase/permease subunit